MKFLLPILCWFLPAIVLPQAKDSLAKMGNIENQTSSTVNNINSKQYKPEIFTNGFIDIINNGQINASARFIRLYIGEPGKFAIPLSLYSAVKPSSESRTSRISAISGKRDELTTSNVTPESTRSSTSRT